MGRIGLVGAMPLGTRWRSQGHIEGSTRYLGTFDTEEEAHRAFLREKENAEQARAAAIQEEVARLLATPTFLYAGGKGRGAAFNGRHFKILSTHGHHQALVVPFNGDTLDFDAQVIVTSSYLQELPQTPPANLPEEEVPAEVEIPAGLREAVIHFLTRPAGENITWAVKLAEHHAQRHAQKTIACLSGKAGISEQARWLRENTDIPPTLIHDVEWEILGGLVSDIHGDAVQRITAPDPTFLYGDHGG